MPLLQVHSWFASEAQWDRLGERLGEIGAAFPGLAIAAILVLAGWLVAVAASWLLRATLRLLPFNAAARRLVGDGLLGAHEPAVLASWALRWLILLASGVIALDVLGFGLSHSLEARLRDLLPRVLTAAVLLVGGSVIAMLLGAVTRRFFEGAGLAGGVMRGRIVSGVLTFFAVLLAVEQLGFAIQFVMALGIVIVAAAGLALALAFGLGSRDLAREFLLEFMRSLDEGRRPRS